MKPRYRHRRFFLGDFFAVAAPTPPILESWGSDPDSGAADDAARLSRALDLGVVPPMLTSMFIVVATEFIAIS